MSPLRFFSYMPPGRPVDILPTMEYPIRSGGNAVAGGGVLDILGIAETGAFLAGKTWFLLGGDP